MALFYIHMNSYQAFAARLSSVPDLPDLVNPYRMGRPGGMVRQANLALYLSRMTAHRPEVLLVGEAPGYRGCRVTGVPFTCESILLSDSSPFQLFGAMAGFIPCGDPDVPWSEATASAVWDVLAKLGSCPLLWNALPFHPHQQGNPRSNRTPRISEIDLGQEPLTELLDLFSIRQVIAVGNLAYSALRRWGIDAGKIRHPGHGGKAAFARQLVAVLRSAEEKTEA